MSKVSDVWQKIIIPEKIYSMASLNYANESYRKNSSGNFSDIFAVRCSLMIHLVVLQEIWKALICSDQGSRHNNYSPSQNNTPDALNKDKETDNTCSMHTNYILIRFFSAHHLRDLYVRLNANAIIFHGFLHVLESIQSVSTTTSSVPSCTL